MAEAATHKPKSATIPSANQATVIAAAPQTQAAGSPRRAHPDLAASIERANRSSMYHVERVMCMDGTYALRHERLLDTPPPQPTLNPPVGEYCIALARNSADVDADTKRLQERPETSLLGPYLGIAAARGLSASFANANGLMNELVRRAQLPQNSQQTDAVTFGTTTPPFVLTQGVALDAGFTQTVRNARTSGTTPPLPARDLNELYVTTDSCFRNIGVTIGQCEQTGRDQAALYLNRESTVSQAITPPATPATNHRGSTRSRNN